MKKQKVGVSKIPDGGYVFSVFAPEKSWVGLKFTHRTGPAMAMNKNEEGYWSLPVRDAKPGENYWFRLGAKVFPDPASHFQPSGVFGPSQLWDHQDFPWSDSSFLPPDIKEAVIYELHIGAFTKQGTLAAAQHKLADLAELGITAVEVMPVAQFSGRWNWGYDGVFPFAVHNTYGDPDSFKSFVNACHKLGMAVVLDVVYNHLGPEGNVFGRFGPYMTKRRNTPWGQGFNYDEEHSHGIRQMVLDNARHWFTRYHIDGLRLDAAPCIVDSSREHILTELSRETKNLSVELGKELWLIAETDENDSRYIKSNQEQGHGLTAMWSDDFHHSVHGYMTGEKTGFYMDFGELRHVAQAMEHGFALQGGFREYRNKEHGEPRYPGLPKELVVFTQNHDLIGNRPNGERLISLVGFEGSKVAAAMALLGPQTPMLFMGEEYGETRPFKYFTDFRDTWLTQQVTQGRKREYKSFGWYSESWQGREEIQDLVGDEQYLGSILNWEKRNDTSGIAMYEYYKELLKIRRRLLPAGEKKSTTAIRIEYCEWGQWLALMRSSLKQTTVVCLFGLGEKPTEIVRNELGLQEQGQDWRLLLDSWQEAWNGPGSRHSLNIHWNTTLRLEPMSVVVVESATQAGR
ncbi:MAG: malto-oligosyltrehalose trehalohydrolase [Desulfovibrio sp.]|nr:MAG: malto-oligosyltrehalose trehalohydrolase [Desulfovibrio sp.]